MSEPVPLLLTHGELADILEDMAKHVRAHDSWEGNIAYLLPEPGQDAEVAVMGLYRIGNLAGQGGVRMLGHLAGPQ